MFEAKFMLTPNDNTYFVPDMSKQQLCWETSPELGGTGGGDEDAALSYVVTHGVVANSVIPHDPSHKDTPAAYPADPWPLTSVFPSPDSWTNHVFLGGANHNQFSNNTTALKMR